MPAKFWEFELQRAYEERKRKEQIPEVPKLALPKLNNQTTISPLSLPQSAGPVPLQGQPSGALSLAPTRQVNVPSSMPYTSALFGDAPLEEQEWEEEELGFWDKAGEALAPVFGAVNRVTTPLMNAGIMQPLGMVRRGLETGDWSAPDWQYAPSDTGDGRYSGLEDIRAAYESPEYQADIAAGREWWETKVMPAVDFLWEQGPRSAVGHIYGLATGQEELDDAMLGVLYAANPAYARATEAWQKGVWGTPEEKAEFRAQSEELKLAQRKAFGEIVQDVTMLADPAVRRALSPTMARYNEVKARGKELEDTAPWLLRWAWGMALDPANILGGAATAGKIAGTAGDAFRTWDAIQNTMFKLNVFASDDPAQAALTAAGQRLAMLGWRRVFGGLRTYASAPGEGERTAALQDAARIESNLDFIERGELPPERYLGQDGQERSVDVYFRTYATDLAKRQADPEKLSDFDRRVIDTASELWRLHQPETRMKVYQYQQAISEHAADIASRVQVLPKNVQDYFEQRARELSGLQTGLDAERGSASMARGPADDRVWLQSQLERSEVPVSIGRAKVGVGKQMGTALYVHRSAEDVIPGVEQARTRLPEDFAYDVVKYDMRTGHVSFFQAPDFDRVAEPVQGDGYIVRANGEVSPLKASASDPWIYHHKWTMVRPDYQGFDLDQSMRRGRGVELYAQSHPGASARYGKLRYWTEKAVPWLEENGFGSERSEVSDEARPDPREQNDVARTSIRQVPKVVKDLEREGFWQKGMVNLHVGAGRYNLTSDYLSERGVESLNYDPYNREPEHNQAIIDRLTENPADNAIVPNVLNVIEDIDVRRQPIKFARKHVKPGGLVIFQMYQAPRAGRTSTGTYQAGMPPREYLDLIREYFPDAQMWGQYIVGHVPQAEAEAPVRQVSDRYHALWQPGGHILPQMAQAGQSARRWVAQNPGLPEVVAQMHAANPGQMLEMRSDATDVVQRGIKVPTESWSGGWMHLSPQGGMDRAMTPENFLVNFYPGGNVQVDLLTRAETQEAMRGVEFEAPAGRSGPTVDEAGDIVSSVARGAPNATYGVRRVGEGGPGVSIDKYLADMAESAKTVLAVDNDRLKDRALYLARQLGYGLADFSDAEIDKALGSTYGSILVRNVFGRQGGVPIDNKQWVEEISRGMADVRAQRGQQTPGVAPVAAAPLNERLWSWSGRIPGVETLVEMRSARDWAIAYRPEAEGRNGSLFLTSSVGLYGDLAKSLSAEGWMELDDTGRTWYRTGVSPDNAEAIVSRASDIVDPAGRGVVATPLVQERGGSTLLPPESTRPVFGGAQQARPTMEAPNARPEPLTLQPQYASEADRRRIEQERATAGQASMFGGDSPREREQRRAEAIENALPFFVTNYNAGKQTRELSQALSDDEMNLAVAARRAYQSGLPIPEDVIAKFPVLASLERPVRTEAAAAEAPAQPIPTIVERTQFRGSDGKWYSRIGGYPSDVRLTDETRSYFVYQAKDGSTYGKQYSSREAAEEDWRVRHEPARTEAAAESEPVRAEEPARPSLLSGAKEDDLDLEVARRAHQGTSWVPEQRAEQERQDYVRHMQAVEAEVLRYADTDERRERATEWLRWYRDGFLKRKTEYLSQRSGIISIMVTGRANFPSARNNKRNETSARMLKEMLEWSENARRKIIQELKGGGPISSDDADAITKLQDQIARKTADRDKYKQINAIVRRKTLTDDQKIEQLMKLRIGEEAARKLLEPGDLHGPGIPSYMVTNATKEIARLQGRVDDLIKMRSQSTTETAFDGGSVVDNVEDNHIQIFFDAKPDEDMRAKLKSKGFKWAPSIGAWQRMRGESARFWAGNLLGIELAPVGEARPEPVAEVQIENIPVTTVRNEEAEVRAGAPVAEPVSEVGLARPEAPALEPAQPERIEPAPEQVRAQTEEPVRHVRGEVVESDAVARPETQEQWLAGPQVDPFIMPVAEAKAFVDEFYRYGVDKGFEENLESWDPYAIDLLWEVYQEMPGRVAAWQEIAERLDEGQPVDNMPWSLHQPFDDFAEQYAKVMSGGGTQADLTKMVSRYTETPQMARWMVNVLVKEVEGQANTIEPRQAGAPARGEALLPVLEQVRAQTEEPVQPERQIPGVDGKEVVVPSPSTADEYTFRYRVVSLDDLTASHDAFSFSRNPEFPSELQPRARTRQAYQAIVERNEREFDPRRVLQDTGLLAHGAPLVRDGVVESGNGRVMSMRRVIANRPEAWAVYQEQLRSRLAEYGIPEDALEGIENPVLVRERVTELTPEERRRFVEIANEEGVARLSSAEQAVVDAGRISNDALARLKIAETETVDQALNATKNREFVQDFMSGVPQSEYGTMMTPDGGLSRPGIERIKAAMLATVYDGPVSERLLTIFTESGDEGIKNVQRGVWESLPNMARAEALIRAGDREGDLSIGRDLAAAIDVLARLRQDGSSVEQFLTPGLFPNDRITPFQAQLLRQIDLLSKSAPQVRDFLRRYANAVIDAPMPGQQSMLDVVKPTRESLFEQARIKTGGLTREQELERLARWQQGLSPQATPAAEGLDDRPGTTGDGRGDVAPGGLAEQRDVSGAEPAAEPAGTRGEPIRPDDEIQQLPEGDRPAGDRGLSEPGGADGGSLRTSGPDIIVAREQFTHPVDPRELAEGDARFVEAKGDALDTYQRQGVYSAIRQLDKGKGFLLADGTGVGKTREILTVADLYAQKGYKVLIVAPKQAIGAQWARTVGGRTMPATFSGSYRSDSDALGVKIELSRKGNASLADGKIILTTYETMNKMNPSAIEGKLLVIYDESHRLKNSEGDAAKSGIALARRADKVVLASASPADKPEHIKYIFESGVLAGQFGGDVRQMLQSIGLTRARDKRGNEYGPWRRDGAMSAETIIKNMAALFDGATDAGAQIKREISMKGLSVDFRKIDPGDAAREAMDVIASAGGDAATSMAQRRQLEPFKVEETVNQALREIEEGRSVVIYANRINPSEVTRSVKNVMGETEREVIWASEGTTKLLKEALAKRGVKDVVEIHGNAEETATEAIRRFNEGEARVMIATVESGGTGINLDDRTGDAPRTMIIMTPPFSGTDNLQAIGRIWRKTTRSDGRVIYMLTDLPVDDWGAGIISTKMKLLGATVGGQVKFLDLDAASLDALMGMDVNSAEYREAVRRAEAGEGTTQTRDVTQDAKTLLDEQVGDAPEPSGPRQRPPGAVDTSRSPLQKPPDDMPKPAPEQAQAAKPTVRAEPWDADETDLFWRRAEHMDLSRDEALRYLGVQDISEWPGTQRQAFERILSVLDSNNPLPAPRNDTDGIVRGPEAPEGRDEEVSLGSGGRPPRSPAVDSPPPGGKGPSQGGGEGGAEKTPSDQLREARVRLVEEMYDRYIRLDEISRESKIPAYLLARRVTVAGDIAEGVLDCYVRPVYDRVGDDFEALRQYRVAMRGLDARAINPDYKMPGGGDPNAILADIEARLGPERYQKVKDAADELWRLNDKYILQAAVSSGRLSQSAYEFLKERWPHYVPFYRKGQLDTSWESAVETMSRLVNEQGRDIQPAITPARNFIKALDLDGSSKELDDTEFLWQTSLISSAMANARNEATRAMVQALEAVGEEVEHGNILSTRDIGVIDYWDNGELQFVRIPKEYAAIARDITPEQAHGLMRILQIGSWGLRKGATQYNPGFVLPNVVRDMFQAYWKTGLIPFSKDYIDGWRAALTKNEDFYRVVLSGAAGGGFTSSLRGDSAGGRARRAFGIPLNNAEDALKYVFRLTSLANERAEQATRIAATLHGERSGRTQELVIKDLGDLAENAKWSELQTMVRNREVTLDFAKYGRLMGEVNSIQPFIAANLQAAIELPRVIKENPGRAFVTAAPLGLASILTYYINKRFESFESIPDYEYIDNYIIMIGEGVEALDPEDPEKEPERFPIYVKIPKGGLVATLTSPVEIMLRAADGVGDYTALETVTKTAYALAINGIPIQPNASVLTPPGVGTMIQLAGNRNFFTGEDIIPEWQSHLAREKRFEADTPKIAVGIGDLFNLSPRMVEFFMRDMSGGVINQVFMATDMIAGAVGYNPTVPGEQMEQPKTGAEKAAELPIVGRFIGTRNTAEWRRASEQVNRATAQAQRILAESDEIVSLNMGVNPPASTWTLPTGEKVDLTTDQRIWYMTTSAEWWKEVADQMVQEDWYQAMAPDERKKAMGRARSVIQNNLRDAIESSIIGAQFGGFNRQALPYLTKALGEYYALENIGATALPEAQAKAAERAQRQYDLLKARGEIKDWREYLLSTGDTEGYRAIKALERVRMQYWNEHLDLQWMFPGAKPTQPATRSGSVGGGQFLGGSGLRGW